MIGMSIRVHGFTGWTHLCEKIKKFDHPVYRAKFPRTPGWVNEDVHADSAAVDPW